MRPDPPQPKTPVASDKDVRKVREELSRIAAGKKSGVEQLLRQALRSSLDQSYQGARTGRFHLAQLSKTEKAHTGSLFEMEVQELFGLADGHDTDFQILGFDVDAKYSHTGKWMIGPEIVDSIALVAQADDYRQTWSAGLVWIRPDRLNLKPNRDAKSTLTPEGKQSIQWIRKNADLPPNPLLSDPEAAVAVMGIQGKGLGQERINELCRQFDGAVLPREIIYTVAQQLDSTKRMRANQGARGYLAPEGIMILNFEAWCRPIFEALGWDPPSPGNFVPLRVARALHDDPEPKWTDASGELWRRARPGEATTEVPAMQGKSQVRTRDHIFVNPPYGTRMP